MRKEHILTSPMTLHDSISSVLPQLGNKLLSKAQAQAEQLGTDNGEALHDFRVSVRHLRSFLKSYEDFTKGAKKHRQRFSDIMTLTNAGRDNEVHLSWLKARQRKADSVEQNGIRYLLEQLSNDDQVDLEKVKKQFASAEKKMEKDFSGKPKKVKTSFAIVTAEVLQSYSKDLEKRLAKIEKSEDDTALHDVRIAGKKLRYTLELLESEAAKNLAKELKGLQDLTGDLHDLQVLGPKVQTLLRNEIKVWSQAFSESAKTLSQTELSQLPQLQQSYDLAAVQRRLGTEKTALFEDLQKQWLENGNKNFFKEVAVLVKELAKPLKAASKRPRKSAPRKTKKRVSAKTLEPVLATPNITNPPASKAAIVN